MTIQPSVVIWTVICFLLLVLILDRLLFRPVLALLDKRRERLDAAREKKARTERLAAERAETRERERTAALAREKKRQSDELERVRADGRARLEAADLERIRRTDGYRTSAEADCAQLLALLSQRADELAVSFAESLTK